MGSYLVDEQFIREFERIRDKVDGAKGNGVRNDPRSLTFNPTIAQPPPPASSRKSAAFVRIQATEDGAGKYSGVLLTTPTTPSGTDAAVSQTDLGDVGTDIYIINALERDGTGHDLNLDVGLRPKDFIGLYLYADPDDGTPTYGIVGFQVSDCDSASTTSSPISAASIALMGS